MAGVSKYTEEMADKICERIANGESLKAICEDDDMPAKATVFKWLGAYPEFVDKYARAREVQADALFDEILSIADDGRNDWMEKKSLDGGNMGWQENGEALRRSQLRIDARKWMAGKLRPKKYSDKLQIDGSMTHEAGDTLQSLMERIAANGKRIHSD
ncbi:terminase small subunit protein [Rhizobium leguminosarum]|uniref:terminase small subunit-like protein n=1 Tax=Rhizobium leguminosarum TaxID=384 RepID=UPI001C96FD04|nr:terminase small subunit protein [Rhizobium leguminosarum]MBY5821474.1 terminase small subunit protein [Rhizobium leguminosarum]